MKLPKELGEAITAAVKQSSQPPAVAARLVALLENLFNGNESLEDRDAISNRLQIILDALEMQSSVDEEEE